MNVPQSARPKRASRPARRSLEAFALPASSAPVAMAPAAQPWPTIQPTSGTQRENGGSGLNAPTAATVHPDTPDEDAGSQSADKAPPTAATVPDEGPAKTFEMVNAHINTALDYGRRLANAKTPAEYVALSTSLAREQWELVIRQTAELGSMAPEPAPPVE
jgi:hypothetical protein